MMMLKVRERCWISPDKRAQIMPYSRAPKTEMMATLPVLAMRSSGDRRGALTPMATAPPIAVAR